MSFLKCVENNFITQLVKKPTRQNSPLDLLFVIREGMMGDMNGWKPSWAQQS